MVTAVLVFVVDAGVGLLVLLLVLLLLLLLLLLLFPAGVVPPWSVVDYTTALGREYQRRSGIDLVDWANSSPRPSPVGDPRHLPPLETLKGRRGPCRETSYQALSW